MWETLDTPLSLGLSLLVKNGQVIDALGIDFDPKRYLDQEWRTARDDYQAVSFIRKFPFEMEGIDRTAAAWEKFQKAEEQCRITNERFRAARLRGFPPRVDAVITIASRKIASWLGKLDAGAWALRCRFGPGADALNKGAAATVYHKLSRLSVTPDFEDGALGLVRSHPAWEQSLLGESQEALDGMSIASVRTRVRQLLQVVPGNRVTFVPKSALIDRTIAIEPGLNIYAQLGLGALIRGRLKKVGLDLDQQFPNQELAREGSVNGEIATIDLSMASDTVATELVRELLSYRPQGAPAASAARWLTALEWCRSKKGTISIEGVERSFRYEKFSSMGNGFTFELESMIFYALALACAEVNAEKRLQWIRAYGDDIAIPVTCVRLLEEVLAFCGFSVNTQKSYSEGVFRESCGADFLNGRNVRPYFLKEKDETAAGLFRLANGIRRVAFRRNLGIGCDRQLRPVWVHVLDRIPNSLRDLTVPFRPVECLTPSGMRPLPWADVESEDGGLAVSHDEAMSSRYVTFARDYQAGWYYAALKARPLSKRYDTNFELLKLYGLYACRDGVATETTSYDQVVGRGESKLRRLSLRAYSPDWLNMVQWI